MKDANKSVTACVASISMLFIVLGISCKKEKSVLPEVDTTEVSVVTPTSASCTGVVISAGSTKLIEKGLCWSDSPSPTIEDSTVSTHLYPCLVPFELRIGGLKPEITYYVRAYATSEAGTSYGNELLFTTPVDLTGEKGTVADADGNIYQTIGIGSQIWIVENLKTTRYNDGTSIPLITGNPEWNQLFKPAYCWYNNDVINKDIYGALYNWYTIQTGKLCPSGWHVPDLKEWKIIETFLGGPDVAGGKMKAAGTDYWKSPNVGATNSSGFTGLPGGFRADDGSFVYIRESNLLWTSTGNKSTSAWYRAQGYIASDLPIGSNTVLWGGSVRCIKD